MEAPRMMCSRVKWGSSAAREKRRAVYYAKCASYSLITWKTADGHPLGTLVRMYTNRTCNGISYVRSSAHLLWSKSLEHRDELIAVRDASREELPRSHSRTREKLARNGHSNYAC